MTPAAHGLGPVLVDGLLVDGPLVEGVLGWPARAESTTALVVATQEPAPVPGEEEVPGFSSPGVVGFLVTFALAVACIPIFMSMVRKVRGVQHRESVDGAPADGAPEGPAGQEGSPGGEPGGSQPAE